jgi:hypothetical protein
MTQEEFEKLRRPYTDIVKQNVEPRLRYYKDRVDGKRCGARLSAVAILALSLVIPVFNSATSRSMQITASCLSLVIALVTGLNEIFKWQEAWKEYSRRIIQIETLIAIWNLEVARCRVLSDDPKEVEAKVIEATAKLLKETESSVFSEMEAFFSQRAKGNEPET